MVKIIKVKLKDMGDYIPKMFLILIVALTVITGIGIAFASEYTIEIRIAPATLNINKVDDKCITVHAGIPYSDFIGTTDTLTLNGAGVDSTKADNCGNLVAKFDRTEIVELVMDSDVTLELVLNGTTKNDDLITGSDVIQVKR
ncbi:MAG TPA: hypothetical protein C5S50_05185 [Methanosarcinaceae archaeon]|nr:hypothetical protein [Methanosarcinaceae archaeon]